MRQLERFRRQVNLLGVSQEILAAGEGDADIVLFEGLITRR
ncbi:MAG TPA: hypothetical protein VGS96_03990 [Thermoanaerobaculia bacterium]|jgi:hypothetical protein|nr:hypothetical protein [Thermoanaerobaculia bacterium]